MKCDAGVALLLSGGGMIDEGGTGKSLDFEWDWEVADMY